MKKLTALLLATTMCAELCPAVTSFVCFAENAAETSFNEQEADGDDLIVEESALNGENGYVLENGMTMPILQFTDFGEDGYTNANSSIQRFCVYVETDHDTDNDGMADLVKVFVQVPTAAVNGDYKAAVIYDPTPYVAGTTTGSFEFDNVREYYNTGFDYDILYKDCEKRPGAKEISTRELALTEDSREWNYKVPGNGEKWSDYAYDYVYYLVRGFAVVNCAGIGTYGSEGYELCGYDLEAESHACVVEWLAGKRVAYSDKEASYEVKADWCNGKVAMTGCSYGGALTYEVATLGVDGLETIIPFAGLARWYEFTNSQGVTKFYNGRYMDNLSSMNSGSLFLDDNWKVINPDYATWLAQIAADQDEANGNYTDIWRISDYSDHYENIKCSALIVHGLNDLHVSTKQSDLMYQALKKAGQTVKLVLHQDGHQTLNGIMVGDEVWQNIMNKWLSHYLLDVENGIEDMAEVTYQSNVDGKFYTTDHWRDFLYKKAEAEYKTDNTDINSKGLKETIEKKLPKSSEDEMFASSTAGEIYLKLPEGQAAAYELDLEEGETVYGTPVIHFAATPSVSGLTGLQITAVLMDVTDDGTAFPAYMTIGSMSYTLPHHTIGRIDQETGYGGSRIKEFVKSYTKGKVISNGWTDLANPGGGEDPSDYSTDTVLEAGTSYEYTLYLSPTVYTLEKGHHLKLVFTTYDPLYESLVDDEYYVDYGYTIDNVSLDVEIPVLS